MNEDDPGGIQVLLETERLVLRAFTERDADNLFQLDSDPEVMRYLNGGVPTPRHLIHQEILPRFIESSVLASGVGFWAAIEKASGEFVGWFGLAPGREGDSSGPALGYRLRRSAWGRGYATEGSRALIRKAFSDPTVQSVTATTYQDNLASRRVMEKVGMSLARTFRMTTDDLVAERTFDSTGADLWDGDDVEYALDRADWERVSDDSQPMSNTAPRVANDSE
ncbi:MAG: GNAT family N-acetyltransferase [Chloroflexota bacterium]